MRRRGSTIAIVSAMVLFMFSLLINNSSGDSERIAHKVSQRLAERMSLLESYMNTVLESDSGQWTVLEDFPEDMVIYQYEYDSLKTWMNQFPVINDDISSRMIFYRLSNLRGTFVSPLADVSDTAKYINLGTKWYVVKYITDGADRKIIGGLEIKNDIFTDLYKTNSGVNPHLKISGKFYVVPLSDTGGSTVYLGEEPMFRLLAGTNPEVSVLAGSVLRWLALLLFTFSIVLYLWVHRTIRGYLFSIAILFGVTVTAYFWGLQMRNTVSVFSPNIYAGGYTLYSFGALLIINTYMLLLLLCTYIMRNNFISLTLHRGSLAAKLVYTGSILAILGGTLFYIHYSLHSLIMNSNISLELYVWNSVSIYTFWVYVSYAGLLFGVLLLLQMLKPVVKDLTGIRYNMFSRKVMFAFATLGALYFTVTSGVLGFRKEQDRVSVWANRLAIDRDLGLELQLRSVEDDIAGDQLIKMLTESDKNNIIILNRLTDTYFSRISRDYDISISTYRDSGIYGFDGVRKTNEKEYAEAFNRRIRSGSPIADHSRFIYAYDSNGVSSYTGVFPYYSGKDGVVIVFIELESKLGRDESGYSNILEQSKELGEVRIPPSYSYAKFISGKLVTYRGTYAYPSVLDDDWNDADGKETHSHFKKGGYTHFINYVSDDEIILVSRPVRGFITYLVTFSYLMLIAYCSLMLVSGNKKKKSVFRKNYFRSRINTMLFCALFFTLVSMAAVSVTFVYKRNEQNMYNMMSDKINTIQAMLESKARHLEHYRDLESAEFFSVMENVANTTKTDITIYTPLGKVYKSTSPEFFDRMVMGTRIDREAYYNIKYRNQRFYIHREVLAGHKYYALYAPLVNDSGKMIAIVSAPYTEQNYNFTRDALFHAATIINLFFILLLTTIIASTTIVNSMFKPLIEMGQKMNSADLHKLEYIIYKREDEISGLVDAYNRMVHDLSDSTLRLAQAERDKAWSEMARQVAHEIKNPLTPIKLEIQRLIRLKQKNDSSWEEKFDKVSSVILEHIEILTGTANEFSTFAKLYSEEPVLIDLDKVLRDQLTIFDNRENISMSYFGMDNAMIMAPKPQLIRVFVNLITNAVQAIEIMQKEESENGLACTKGQILICLRKSIKDGFYDVVFEDNGPGVKNENLAKLFTPNFTTKSGGTGLGLAICRNIIEKCDGEITYQRSFGLKGACFTVRLPEFEDS